MSSILVDFPGANDAEWDELLGNFATGTDKLLRPDRKVVARQCSQKIAALQRVICDQSPVPGCDSPLQSPTQTSILIPSTDDLDSLPVGQRLPQANDDARRETLDLLLKTFRGSVKVDPPPDDVCIVTEICGPTSTSVPNASASLFSSPDSTVPSSRVVDTAAPPPPVSSVHRPGDASPEAVHCNGISDDGPSSDLGGTSSSNPGSTMNSDDSPGDSIPPAQSRAECSADVIPPDDDVDAWLPEARARLNRLLEVGDPASQHQQNPLPSTGNADHRTAAGGGTNPESDDDLDKISCCQMRT